MSMNIDPFSLAHITDCVNLATPMNDSVSSLEVFNGVLCSFFMYVYV